ncbi:MAG: DJ-1/PfpI family protein [Oscillospiraceae bacterium]|nr:DJ-1/PfpI family protein [Oscillospiraceae bacterium]
MLYIFFAPGFEETEAVATLDMIRRAEVEIKSVGVGAKTVTGSHGITVVCDLLDSEISLSGLEGIILPGGMPGTLNLEKSPTVQAAIDHAARRDLLICAICAAPSILGNLGMLTGRRYTCFPGFEQRIEGGQYTGSRVERDGKLITAKGPGASILFALEIIRQTAGEQIAHKVEVNLQ